MLMARVKEKLHEIEATKKANEDFQITQSNDTNLLNQDELYTRKGVRELINKYSELSEDVKKILYTEREKYIVKKIIQCKGKKIICVVGMAHLDGIQKLWMDKQFWEDEKFWNENENISVNAFEKLTVYKICKYFAKYFIFLVKLTRFNKFYYTQKSEVAKINRFKLERFLNTPLVFDEYPKKPKKNFFMQLFGKFSDANKKITHNYEKNNNRSTLAKLFFLGICEIAT
ncbi:hypothetical protein RFI_05549 [Reticulomyxa filosa]|uniref:TraB family protein n=1 Tax=Reticulomyxa filosa TaxID=46433 RepID=X6NZZ4_RETFI|nr:hypothetical protein RFI_05549 [Reticulomyxa filosa]|eukprot:ETO31571.1 hypothetical protein RFI_05549 [Reticulomyxa filosa]